MPSLGQFLRRNSLPGEVDLDSINAAWLVCRFGNIGSVACAASICGKTGQPAC